MIADMSTGWQVTTIAAYGAAALVIALAGYYLVPDLWREGRLAVRLLLSPDKVDLKRRRELDAAAIGKRAS